MMRRIALAVFVLLVVSPIAAQSEDLEILSKEDARMMFSSSKDQWNADVEHTVTAGYGMATGSRESAFSLTFFLDRGAMLTVHPSYVDTSEKPSFIRVTVGYPRATTVLLDKEVLNEAIEVAKKQMSPEYTVTAAIEDLEDGWAIYFKIMEAEPNSRTPPSSIGSAAGSSPAVPICLDHS